MALWCGKSHYNGAVQTVKRPVRLCVRVSWQSKKTRLQFLFEFSYGCRRQAGHSMPSDRSVKTHARQTNSSLERVCVWTDPHGSHSTSRHVKQTEQPAYTARLNMSVWICGAPCIPRCKVCRRFSPECVANEGALIKLGWQAVVKVSRNAPERRPEPPKT